MKKHIVVITLVVLSALTNLTSCLLTYQAGLEPRNVVFAIVSLGMLALLYALRDYLPPSRTWTLASALRFGLYCAALEVFMLVVDQFARHTVNIVSSTGVATFLAMILLMNLNGSSPQAKPALNR